MIRKIALAGAAGAIALAGLAATVGSAGAAPPQITNVTSANIQCNLAATKAKISPALVNNWQPVNHNGVNDVPGGTMATPAGQNNARNNLQAESVAGYNDNETFVPVKNLPFTKYSVDGNNTVSSNSKTVSCTGSVTQTGVGTFAVTSLKIKLENFTNGTDNAPLNVDNTCGGLLAGSTPEDVAATYKATITPKLNGAKMTASTTTNLSLLAGGGGAIGFQIATTPSSTTSGPLVGSNSKTTAYVNSAVLNAVSAHPSKSTTPTPTKGVGDKCQAGLKIKQAKPGKNPGDPPKKPATAQLKKPKGLKKIEVGNNLLPPNQPSNICIRKGTDCP